MKKIKTFLNENQNEKVPTKDLALFLSECYNKKISKKKAKKIMKREGYKEQWIYYRKPYARIAELTKGYKI